MSTEEFKSPYFSVVKEDLKINKDQKSKDYYSIQTNDWVQIVVEPKPNEFLMIEQYRHSGRHTFLEFPGGVIDQCETPLQAAFRELLEETGYQVKNLTLVGENYSNPALLNNKIYTFYTNEVTAIQDQKLDPNENINIKLISMNELNTIIKKNNNHALMLSSYLLVLQHKS